MISNALYYPYIHIKDADWLKATLLLFPQVRRMVPADFTPDDSPQIHLFTQAYKGNPSLLCSADLFSKRVVQAQETLASRLVRDAEDPNFRTAYGYAATRKELAPDAFGFQIHQMKLQPTLRTALRDSGLAWVPGHREPYDVSEYVELHHRVGEAVMSTLAIACALHEGLDIVGDKRSEQLHRCLIEKDERAVYDAWLHPDPIPPKPQPATGEELFEFMVGFACKDLSKVTPERLALMHEDREPIRNLVSQLREHARHIPEMDPGPDRRKYLEQAVSEILKNWRKERANMSRFWREFFGEGLVDMGAKFLADVAKGAGFGTVSGAVAGATTIGALTAGVVGAAAGVAIGVAAHTAKSVSRIRKRAVESPFRYLTTLERAGVVFRSDLND